jgi:hypothetical protein
MKGRVSISIFIRSPVILVFSHQCICRGSEQRIVAVDNVIMEVSATTVAKSICQPLPHCLDSCCGHKWLSFAVDKVRTPQDLSVAIDHSRYNVVTEEAQIPTKIIPCTS